MNRLLQLHQLNEQHRNHIEQQERKSAPKQIKTIIIEGDFSELMADEERRKKEKESQPKQKKPLTK